MSIVQVYKYFQDIIAILHLTVELQTYDSYAMQIHNFLVNPNFKVLWYLTIFCSMKSYSSEDLIDKIYHMCLDL